MLTTAVVLCSITVLIELIFVPLYLKKMWPTKNWHSLFYKMICATGYVLIAALAAAQAEDFSSYAMLMLLGFVFSWLGDLLLHIPKPTKLYFLIGTAMFATAHIFYCWGYIKIQQLFFPGSPNFFRQEFAAAVSLMLAFMIATYSKGLRLGKLLIPMSAYGIFVSMMTIKSTELGISLLIDGRPSMLAPAILLLVGGISFSMSDGSLALITFDTRYKKFKLKVFNIVTYFIAQLCLAFTVFFFN